ncbi:MAG: hypothetical protein HY560_03180 [Gemmatimonadetes bacterium]|nr:hypothetical protein [Gemmatimonadota bacterium]
MTEQEPSQSEGQYSGFSYFMIRVQRPVPARPATVSGLIERLGTGDKRQFSSERELLALLRTWPADPSKMAPAGGQSKSDD